MKTKAHLIILAGLGLGSLFLFAGCDDDGDGVGGAGAQNAPASVANTGFSFNPTVTFTDDTNFDWENDAAGSPFPDGPFSGTYVFNRDSDSEVSIDLTAGQFDGGSLTITLRNFVGTASSITDFDVIIDGQTFSAEVVSGTLVPQPSGDISGAPGIPDDSEATPTDVPPALVGQYTLTYFEANPGGPFTDGETVGVTIGQDGSLTIGDRVLTEPFNFLGNELEVIWFDGEFAFAASGMDSLNEINVARGYDFRDEANFLFLGQLAEDAPE